MEHTRQFSIEEPQTKDRDDDISAIILDHILHTCKDVGNDGAGVLGFGVLPGGITNGTSMDAFQFSPTNVGGNRDGRHLLDRINLVNGC